MRERKAVFHMQSNPSAIQKLLKRGLQAGTEQINIIGIEMDGPWQQSPQPLHFSQ